MRCKVCGDNVSGLALRFWRKPHYQDSHPQYAIWEGRWFRNLYFAASGFVLVLILSDSLWLSYDGKYGYLAGVANLLFVVFVIYDWSWVRRRSVQRFVSQWQDANAHGKPKETIS